MYDNLRKKDWLKNPSIVPDRFGVCSLNKPLCLYISPGDTSHIPCELHPEGHDVHGADIISM